jgi:hypothetical protein
MRALKVVHYEDLDNKVAEFRAAQKILRDEKKDAMLRTLASIPANASTQNIIETMQALQKELDQSTEMEALLLEFVNSVKQ